jgi:N-methylhydantoinase B
MAEKMKTDMITLQLINSFLYALVDEMTQTVVRTSLSPITRDSFDSQCGFCGADGEMLIEGEGVSIHSMVYTTLIANWLKEHPDDTYSGDIMVTNDPYSGAAHLCDIYMYQPIFIGDVLAAWAVAGGHQRDVGGAVPGSGACNSTEIYQEGLRIPPMKLYKKGVRNDDLYRIIGAASRAPDIIEGDIEAFRASCNTARERFHELVENYGWETLKVYFAELLNYAERLTRAEIKAMPDGGYEFTDYLDDGGRGYVDDEGNVISDLVPIHVKITVDGDEITYDFTGTSPQVRGAMNNPYGTTRATVMACLRYMVDTDIPRNGGAFRPVKLIVPEGTLLNPRLPGACASRGATLGRQTDVLLGAQAKINPYRMMGCASNVDTLVCIASHETAAEPFIFMEAMWGGWGGRSFVDGVDYNTCPELNGSNEPCETNEELYPIRYNRYSYVSDKEGAGKYRGSVALIRERQLLADEATLSLRVERQRTGPYGIAGGQAGLPLEAILNPDTERRHVGKVTLEMKRGDVIQVTTAGAGGWGNPLERDANSVLEDVRNEKISWQRARDAYGVVIDEDTMQVDEKNTGTLREAMAKGTSSSG